MGEVNGLTRRSKIQPFLDMIIPSSQRLYVTVHAETNHKSAILILRYGGGRQNQRIFCFFIFFAQGMRKAL